MPKPGAAPSILVQLAPAGSQALIAVGEGDSGLVHVPISRPAGLARPR